MALPNLQHLMDPHVWQALMALDTRIEALEALGQHRDLPDSVNHVYGNKIVTYTKS